MKYADSVRIFITSYLANALVLTTPHALLTAWLKRQTFLAQEGVNFNEDQVLASKAYEVYTDVEQAMIASGDIQRIYINYNDIAITIYLPKEAQVLQ